MPLFEYDCSLCHQVVEVLQKVNAPDPEACGPDCVCEGPNEGTGPITRRRSVPGGYTMGRMTSPEPPSCGHCGMAPGSCEK